MAIDPSIYNNIQQPQIESPINALTKASQFQGVQNQNKLMQMQLQQADRAMQDEQATRQAYQLADPAARMEALRLASPKAYREEQKFQTDQQKAQREAEKSQYEAVGQRLGLAGQVFGQVKQNPTLQSANDALDFLGKNGVYDAQTIAKYKQVLANDPSPQTIARLADQALTSSLTSAQQLEQIWKQKGFDLDTEKFGEAKRHNRATEGISGGNLRVAQEGLNLRKQEIANGKNQAPTGYRFTAERNLEAIPGGPADIKAGEAGAKREKQIQGSIASAERVLGTVRGAIDRVGSTTAGFGGSTLAKIPGTSARDLASDVETIKANLGFDRLQQMRDESPTGGALGAIAVQELVALQSTVASLDTAQSPEQLKRNLKKIDQHYTNWLKTMKGEKPSGVSVPKEKNVFDAADAILNGGK